MQKLPQEKYGFVYIWFDKKHKRYYIGCHWGFEDDGYICSSFWMKQAYKRRPQDFKRRILSRIYTSKKELLEKEYEWFSLIKPEELKVRYYNLNISKNGHWTATDKALSIGQKISQTQLGRKRKPTSEETKAKISLANKGRPNKHKGNNLSEEHKAKIVVAKTGKKRNPHSEEHKAKLSLAHKNMSDEKKAKMIWMQTDRPGSNTGKKHSKETKERLSLLNKGKKLSDETKAKMSATRQRLSQERKLSLIIKD